MSILTFNEISATTGNIEMIVSVIDSRVSPSSCRSIQDQLLDAVQSSTSLVSVDDGKMMTKANSVLDPGAPVFVPRHSQSQIDEDHETVINLHIEGIHDHHYFLFFSHPRHRTLILMIFITLINFLMISIRQTFSLTIILFSERNLKNRQQKN